MPWLASLFVTLFGGLASFFAQYLTKKVALAAAAISTFGLLTVGFYATLSALIAGLLTSFPVSGGLISTMIWLAVPDSAPAIIAAVIGADTALALYRWNVDNLKLASYVT